MAAAFLKRLRPAPAPPAGLSAGPEAHVFVVTYGRSGSTLLQNLLNQIEGVCIRGENAGTLAHLIRAWAALADCEPVQSHRRIHRSLTRTHPWYGSERVENDRLARRLVQVFTQEVLQPPPGTKIAGFKEIRWHQDPEFFAPQLDFITRYFTGARFVFNTRDPAAVARSGWWAHQDSAKVMAMLEGADRLYADYAAAHPERCCLLRYEDYTADPRALAPLFDLLDRPFDAALVDRVLGERLDHLKKSPA